MDGFDKDRVERLKGWMQGYVDTRKYAGCSALIAQGGGQRSSIMSAVCVTLMQNCRGTRYRGAHLFNDQTNHIRCDDDFSRTRFGAS